MTQRNKKLKFDGILKAKSRSRGAIGKANRIKGANAERFIVNDLKEYVAEIQRYAMMETGHIEKGDVRYKRQKNHNWTMCQVKHEIAVPSYIYTNLEGFKIMFVKKPRQKWLVIMDLDTFKKEYL